MHLFPVRFVRTIGHPSRGRSVIGPSTGPRWIEAPVVDAPLGPSTIGAARPLFRGAVAPLLPAA
jgi:hypothetical protein